MCNRENARTKKKKKDPVSADEAPVVEELRGTAAVFGEGDVLIHSPLERGTGGHWCAKLVFFSLLAVLVTLVALIILENRGLSELEVNSVESRYSAVLEGWLEEPSDDHHDEHTLELSHPTEDEHDLSEDEAELSEEQDVELEDIEHEPEEIEEHVARTHFAEPYQPPDGVEDEDNDDDQLTYDDDGDDNEEEPEQLESETNENDDDDDDENDKDEYLENGETDNGSDDDNDDQNYEDDQDDDDQDEFDDNISDGGDNNLPYEELEESKEELPEDSLLEEEEYEKQQEELRKAEEEESHRGGAQMMPEEEWGEEPNEERWRQELDQAQHEMNRGSYRAALARAGAPELTTSARARWLVAYSLDRLAEERKDNGLLERAVQAYLMLIENHRLTDGQLVWVAERAIDRARFRGTPLAALAAHRALVSRFPRRRSYRHQTVVTCLMANRLDLATEELKSTLSLWPKDRVSLAHYGFVLKMKGDLPEAVRYLEKALSNSTIRLPDEAKFHYHLGDALLQLDRREEAREAHERGARLGWFRSAEQRSLYNVERLTAQAWWRLELTPYRRLKEELEASWKEILREGQAAVALYEAEKEGLRTSGEWSQLELMSRGREVGSRCAHAPTACGAARRAGLCTRGQTKFSLLAPGTHVRPHTGPTNCRIRVHLALANTEGAYIRVHNETRQWEVGRVLAFDDSFEHEVWHNGTRPRLVLILDVWHPELTPQERQTLPPI